MNNRKINRKLLGMLPEQLRFTLMRKSVHLDPTWPSPLLEIKIAETDAELSSAYRLLHDSYVSSGFMDPDPSGMRVLPQHLLPQTTTIVVKWDSIVIGTLSLIRDNPFGLPMEKIFSVDDRRKNGRRLAEVSSLAVDPLYRRQINLSLFPLFRYVYQYAKACFGIHEFVIAVNPSMVDLYLGFICFKKLKSKPISYDFVKGAPAVGLYLDFADAPARWEKIFGHLPTHKNFYQYWTQFPTHENNKIPKREYHSASDPILTPKLLSEFFLEKAQLNKKLTAKELKIVMDVYPYPNFKAILEPLYLKLTRRNLRLETQMKGQWENCLIPTEVLNVSKDGMLVRTLNLSMKIGDQSYIKVWLNDTTPTQLKVELFRTQDNSLHGLKILENSAQWMEMVETIENHYQNVEENYKKAA